MNEFAMHVAARDGDLEKVRQLIAAGEPVDSLDDLGISPLHTAACCGQYEMAELLIDCKCNVNLKDRYGRTPAMAAFLFGQKYIVDLLLHRGAQVNCVDDCRRTLLHHASSSNGRADIVRLILDNGEADLNAVDFLGRTPLTWAAMHRNEEVAALLIRAGADVNRGDMYKKTALHWAVESGRSRMIQILLEKEGLDISPQDNFGDTPLHLACQDYCQEAIKQLLDAGADTNVKNNRGETPLSEGLWGLSHEEIRLFVQNGAFLENCYYECTFQSPFRNKNVLKDVEICTQSVVNKFNRQSLPALNSIAYFAKRLPNVDNFKLGARHIDEVKKLVKCEIERNTFCDVFKARNELLL